MVSNLFVALRNPNPETWQEVISLRTNSQKKKVAILSNGNSNACIILFNFQIPVEAFCMNSVDWTR